MDIFVLFIQKEDFFVEDETSILNIEACHPYILEIQLGDKNEDTIFALPSYPVEKDVTAKSSQNPGSLISLIMASILNNDPKRIQELPVELQDLATQIPRCQYCLKYRAPGRCSADLKFKIEFHRLMGVNGGDWNQYNKYRNCPECQLCESLVVDKIDVELIMKHTNCCWHQAVQALKNHDSDLVEAIIELTI